MSNLNMIRENQVEMVELSDEAMEAVSGGLSLEIEVGPIELGPLPDVTFTIGDIDLFNCSD